jgi:hypothetical protein
MPGVALPILAGSLIRPPGCHDALVIAAARLLATPDSDAAATLRLFPATTVYQQLDATICL